VAYDPSRAVEARSELELRFLDLAREAGLPAPQVNVLVEGFVVDAYWPCAHLVVELQGYAYHSDRAAFERDHARLARLKLAGYEVLALTWRQVTEEPAWVAGAIRSLLGRVAAAGAPGTRTRATSADR
jgi:very-short-patch-repair endonuclease